jgi:small subunit ribosomal protein S1
MTSDPTRPPVEDNETAQPNATADQTAVDAPSVGETSASEGSRPSDRIRIGSARGIDRPIAAVPQVKPVAPLAQAGQSPTPAGETLVDQSVVAESSSSQQAYVESAEASSAESEGAHQQATADEPAAFEVAPPPPSVTDAGDGPRRKYPPPNLRSKLPDDLEAEMQAMLSESSLEELMDSSTAKFASVTIAAGSRHTGRVAKVFQDDVFVELPGKQQGLVSARQFAVGELPEIGTEIDVLVISDGEDGLYELSLPTAAIEVGNWDDVQEGAIVEVAVTGVNKGGLECEVAGIRAFMPMGQISMYRVETPEDMVGQRITAVVTEASRERRNLVLSHRAVMERERAEKRDKLLAELAPGQIREGTVRSVRDFGAFVDLGGVDGLVHVSKMSWDRVSHPSEVVSEGQVVKVKIERIDTETGKIGLSLRESAENPWDSVESKYHVGDKLKGTVSKTMDFGAFVKLEPGVEGLIHISELAHGRVFRTSDVVKEGQDVEVKLLGIDREKQRISLSLRALIEAPQKADKADDEDAPIPVPPDAPKAPTKRSGQLKGGIGTPSGGDKFGLK